MKQFFTQTFIIGLNTVLSTTGAFSQITDVYSALLLKPGHVYLSSDQMKVNAEKPKAVKSLSLEKNTRYAFSIWTKKEHRDFMAMQVYQNKGRVLACLNPAYETSRGVRYFYFKPQKSGLFYVAAELHNDTIKQDVYLIQGLFFTEPELPEGRGDKKFSSGFCP